MCGLMSLQQPRVGCWNRKRGDHRFARVAASAAVAARARRINPRVESRDVLRAVRLSLAVMIAPSQLCVCVRGRCNPGQARSFTS